MHPPVAFKVGKAAWNIHKQKSIYFSVSLMHHWVIYDIVSRFRTHGVVWMFLSSSSIIYITVICKNYDSKFDFNVATTNELFAIGGSIAIIAIIIIIIINTDILSTII